MKDFLVLVISIPKWSYFNALVNGSTGDVTEFQSQNGLILTLTIRIVLRFIINFNPKMVLF